MDLDRLIPEKYITDCLKGSLHVKSPFRRIGARIDFLKKADLLCKDFAKCKIESFETDISTLEKELFKPKDYDKDSIEYNIATIDSEKIRRELDSTFFRSIYKECLIVRYIISSRCLINLDKKVVAEIYKRFRLFDDIDEHFTIICNCKNLMDYKKRIDDDGKTFVKAVDVYYNAIA